MKIFNGRGRKITGNENGFMIIEGLIAIAVFTIVMTYITAMIVGSVKTNDLGRDITDATSLGADVVERISLLPYNDPNLQNNTYVEPDAMDGKYSFAINTATDAVLENTMLITVTVNWRYRGTARSVIITDIKVDYV
jgi:Tfp pilus assembly protein PilV